MRLKLIDAYTCRNDYESFCDPRGNDCSEEIHENYKATPTPACASDDTTGQGNCKQQIALNNFRKDNAPTCNGKKVPQSSLTYKKKLPTGQGGNYQNSCKKDLQYVTWKCNGTTQSQLTGLCKGPPDKLSLDKSSDKYYNAIISNANGDLDSSYIANCNGILKNCECFGYDCKIPGDGTKGSATTTCDGCKYDFPNSDAGDVGTGRFTCTSCTNCSGIGDTPNTLTGQSWDGAYYRNCKGTLVNTGTSEDCASACP
jgi:hypothetical protein